MYPHPIFGVDDPEELNALLHSAGLGTLITNGSNGLVVTHIPFFFDEKTSVLRGHLSRSNPHHEVGPTSAMVLFQFMEAYVTPSWYPSKARHGRVAPTWNYEFLHVHGQLRWTQDPEWLLNNVEEVTDRFEARQLTPWKVSDAPPDFAEKLVPAIFGLEIAIERVECRRKMSQHSNEADRNGVIRGLTASNNPADQQVAKAMGALFHRQTANPTT